MQILLYVGLVCLISVCTAFAIDVALQAGEWEEHVSVRLGLYAVLIVAIPLLLSKTEGLNRYIPRRVAEKRAEAKLTRYMYISMSGVVLGFLTHASFLA